ncbi:hypothetical protein TWF481_004546 [Arthrobotrys musiformis]|uniref:Uncharacterized protein n=1 Tax=Arthrobotrys musiformis TaxID=47236 RepID=A0AAV9WJU5_9PEZI
MYFSMPSKSLVGTAPNGRCRSDSDSSRSSVGIRLILQPGAHPEEELLGFGGPKRLGDSEPHPP